MSNRYGTRPSHWVEACVVLLSCAPVAAQDRREPQLSWEQLPPTHVRGKVGEIGVGLIHCSDEENNPCFIKVDPSITRVSVTGTAEPSVLRPGLLVQFTAEFDGKRNSISAPLEALQIFAPGAYPLGIINDSSDGKGPTFRVAGAIKSYKDGKLVILVGKKSIKAVLADAVVISVELGDYSLAKPGDEIDVQGRLFRQGQVIGELVKVKLAEPIKGEMPTQRRSRPPRAAPVARAKSEAPADEPEPNPEVNSSSETEADPFGDD